MIGMESGAADTQITLSTEQLRAEIILPDTEYCGSRYDHSGIVSQVTTHNGHTYLSKEWVHGGPGMGGVGLSCVFEWTSTELYDSTNIADFFPMLGVGLVKKPNTNPFYFPKPYPVVPFKKEVSYSKGSMTVRVLPHLCQGIACEQVKTVRVSLNTLSIENTLSNVGSKKIEAIEFCHNFLKFDGHTVDDSYKILLPYQIKAYMRRGELKMGPSFCSLGAFDEESQSTAFWLEGYEGLKTHWIKIENFNTKTSLLIEDFFPLNRLFFWCNPEAICPETYFKIDLQPGEKTTFVRRYTFS
jgi:hypothetical protein